MPNLGLGASVSKSGIVTPGLVTGEDLVLSHKYPVTEQIPLSDGSLRFDGSNDYANGSLPVNIEGQTKLTFTAWIKAREDECPIVGKGAYNDSGAAFHLKASDTGRISFSVREQFIYWDGALPDTGWHHIAIVWDEDAGTTQLWVDGILDSPTSSGGTYAPVISESNTFLIGRNTSSGSTYGNMSICNLGIWYETKTQSQIKSIMQKTYSELSVSEKVGLTEWFDFGSSYNVVDPSPGVRSLASHNGTVLVINGANVISGFSPKKYRAIDSSGNNNHGQIYSGRALEFDGITDYLTGPDDTRLPIDLSKDFTVAVWFKVDTAADAVIWALKQNNENRMGLVIADHGEIAQNHYDDRNDQTDYVRSSTGPGVINTDTWYRAVCVWTGIGATTKADTAAGLNSTTSHQKFYINGVAPTVSDESVFGSELGPSQEHLQIGAIGSPLEDWFSGKMSDFQVWDYAWTAEDVAYDYKNPEQLALNRGGTSLTESNLKLWYPMNDGHRGQQSYVLDASNTGLGDEMISSDLNAQFDELNTDSNNTVTYPSSSTARITTTDGSNVGIRDADLLTAGVTYKCTVDGTVHSGSGFKIQDNAAQHHMVETTGVYTFFFTANDTYLYIFRRSASVASDFTINSISVKPVNDKNHATTVFLGDEQIDAEKNRVFGSSPDWLGGTVNGSNTNNDFATYDEAANSGATEGDYFTDNYLKVISDDDGSNVQYCKLDGAYWETFNGGMVVGRTYRLSYSVEITTATSGTLSVGFAQADATATIDEDYDRVYSGTQSAATHTTDFVYAGTTTHAQLVIKASTSSVFTAYFDNFSIKEVGTATGWSDADQQLDIQQTALQSYNELAWFNNATQGSGITNYVVMGDDAALNVGEGDFSLSAWFFLHDMGESGDSHYLLRKGGAGAEGYAARVTGLGKISCNIDEQGGTPDNQWTDSASGVIVAGKWYHVVFSYDRSGDVYCYLNGERITSGEFTTAKDITGNSGTLDNSTAFNVGASSSTSGGFPGTITEVALFKGAGSLLTQSHAEELYNDGKALDAKTHSQNAYLAGYWRNNGLSKWTDLSGNENDGTPGNITETILQQAGVDASRDCQGFLMNRQKDTNGLNLCTNLIASGIEEGPHVSVQGPIELGTTPFSMTMWLKKYKDWKEQWILSQFVTDSTRWYVRANNSNPPRFQFYARVGSSDTSINVTNGSFDLDANGLDTWIHLGLTTNRSDSFKWYINGSLVETDTNLGEQGSQSPDDNLSNGGNLTIGWNKHASFNDHHFNGEIDDVMIYTDKEMSAKEIKRNYKAGKRSHK